jgi:hypothetical protein
MKGNQAMGDPHTDRPFGDDGFSNPRKRGWLPTILGAVFRAVIGSGAGAEGRQWPRQLPLHRPQDDEDYRP